MYCCVLSVDGIEGKKKVMERCTQCDWKVSINLEKFGPRGLRMRVLLLYNLLKKRTSLHGLHKQYSRKQVLSTVSRVLSSPPRPCPLKGCLQNTALDQQRQPLRGYPFGYNPITCCHPVIHHVGMNGPDGSGLQSV